jgi:hypothetical protein
MADQQPAQQQPRHVRDQKGMVEQAPRGAENLRDEQRGGPPRPRRARLPVGNSSTNDDHSPDHTTARADSQTTRFIDCIQGRRSGLRGLIAAGDVAAASDRPGPSGLRSQPL